MKITSAIVSLYLIFFPKGVEAQDSMWEEIEIPKDVTGILAGVKCSKELSGKQVPKVQFTIEPVEPSDPEKPITVSATPPNTFISTNKGLDQEFEFKPGISSISGPAGIRIKLPPAQLEKVEALHGDDVMIEAGFTDVKEVKAHSSSNLVADLSTVLAGRNITVQVESSAKATIKTTTYVESVQVSSSGQVMIENANVPIGNAKASSSGSMSIKGDVYSVIVDSSGQLTVDGSLILAPSSEFVGWVSSSGSLKIGPIETGPDVKLPAVSSGNIVTTDCDNVRTESSGSCRVGTQPSVSSVDVTASGSYTGGSDKKYCFKWDDWWDNGSSRLSTSVVTSILFSIVVFMV